MRITFVLLLVPSSLGGCGPALMEGGAHDVVGPQTDNLLFHHFESV